MPDPVRVTPTMRCAYCNTVRPWNRDEFPSIIYAVCWTCWVDQYLPRPKRTITERLACRCLILCE